MTNGCSLAAIGEAILFGDLWTWFVNSILDATWHICHFRPDVIIFDWIGDCKPTIRLVAMLHRIKPDVAMFHLDLPTVKPA